MAGSDFSRPRRRVVVTGLGLVSPLGLDVPTSWSALIEGKSGVGPITRFDPAKHTVKIAAEVQNFNPEVAISPKEVRKMGLFIQFALVAATEALKNAGLSGRFGESGDAKTINPTRVGCHIASGMGGIPELEYWVREIDSKEKKLTTPFFVPLIIPNMSSGHASTMFNAQGPNLCIVSACASSAHGIGEATRLIRDGTADIMIAGGAEAVTCELVVGGFAAMRALSTRNDDPTHASRPYDRDRDGFVLGEGAGILILEEFEHAKKRGAPILAEILGYGLNADAFHMTAPAPEGAGAQNCIHLALQNAGIDATEVGYVNSHGTSTPTGDGLEAKAIARVFQKNKNILHVSSTKSSTGHMLGASGAAESVFSILSLKNGIIPATQNLDNLDEECAATGLNFTAKNPVNKQYKVAASNSFGFGGTNATLIFGKL